MENKIEIEKNIVEIPTNANKSSFKLFPKTKAIIKHLFLFIFMTANIISFSILSNKKDGYTLSLVLYVLISLHLLTKHFKLNQTTINLSKITYYKVLKKFINTLKKYWAVFAIVLFAILMIGTSMFTEINNRTSKQSRGQCLVGILFFLGIMIKTSKSTF